MASKADVIDIVVMRDKAFIWNSEDCCRAREKWRIVGNLVGSLPRAPRQNCQLGLPLQLMPEEATLLHEIGAARLIQHDRKKSIPQPTDVEQFRKTIDDLSSEQNRLFKKERRRRIIEMGDQIVEGKRLKIAKSCTSSEVVIDREQILREELDKIDRIQTPTDSCMVQLFRENPWIERNRAETAIWNFPRTDNEVLKYFVFRDLWKKGNYLTSGSKFGGDYLVYPGDPLKYHASHIALCIGRNDTLTGHDIIAKGRLGTIVKKTILLCSVGSDQKLQFIALKWTGTS